jgi:Flagellar motor protein
MAKREHKEPSKPSTAWQGTYGDMITLMLCFFVMLYDPSESDAVQMAEMTASLSNSNPGGGISASAGRLADLGNVVSALPSMEKGKSLGTAKKKAVSVFAPDVKTNRITITSDERGLVITLAADNFFKPGSADLDVEDTRDTLLRLSEFFNSPELKNRKFRIEGHTDNTPVAADSVFPSNWELSATRAANVLHYLTDFGLEKTDNFSIAGFADTQPKFSNDVPEEKAYNNRVDIVILDEGHF